MTDVTLTRAPSSAAGDPSRRSWSSTFIVGATALIVATAVLVVLSIVRNDGHLVYALDDAAIHMSMVKNLAEHGTWGVVPHHYVSASSSPGWVLLLLGPVYLLPGTLNVLPLVVNLLSAVAIVWLLAREQRFLQPQRRDWLSGILLAELIVVAMLLPTAVLVGMEHTTQALLVLLALVLFQHIAIGAETPRTGAALVGTLFLAGLFRPESIFAAVGIAVGLLALAVPRLSAGRPSPLQLRRALTTGLAGIAAAAVSFLVYGLVSVGFGLSLVPTSIESKSLREFKTRIGIFRSPAGALDVLRSDNLLLVIFLGVLVYVVLALSGPARKNVPLALAFLVTVGLHCFIADIGQMDRYQAYLLVAGVYTGLVILGEVIPMAARTGVVLLLIAVIPALGAIKVGLVWDTPTATSNTYLQRYQVGRFLERYYDGEPVATGELGYVTLFHDGPVTDLLGIGDPEVLDEFDHYGGHLPPETVERITRERDVQVVATYPVTLVYSTPPSWRFGGRWLLEEKSVTAFDRNMDFFAIDDADLEPLIQRLDAQAAELPTGTRYMTFAEALELLAGNTEP
jgi:hypothetical protein